MHVLLALVGCCLTTTLVDLLVVTDLISEAKRVINNVCRKLCNPWHSFLRYPTVPFVWGIRKFNLIAPKLRKIEAIQTSLFINVLNAFSAMINSLSAAIRFRIIRLLQFYYFIDNSSSSSKRFTAVLEQCIAF